MHIALKLIVLVLIVHISCIAAADERCGWVGTITIDNQFKCSKDVITNMDDRVIYQVNADGFANFNASHSTYVDYGQGATFKGYGNGSGKTRVAVKFDLASGTYRIELFSAKILIRTNFVGIVSSDSGYIPSRANWGENGPDGCPEMDGVTFGPPWGKLDPDKTRIKGIYHGITNGPELGIVCTSTLTWDLKAVGKPKIDVDRLADDQKTSPGALLVKNYDNNNAPRKKITLRLPDPLKSFACPVELHWSGQLTLFKLPTGGDPIAQDGSANIFTTKDLPQIFYVEGTTESNEMQDAEVYANLTGHKTKDDVANFTILWIDKPEITLNGKISDDNPLLENYKRVSFDFSSKLGPKHFYDFDDSTGKVRGLRMGWGLQACAHVHPSKFNYPLKKSDTLCLDRDCESHNYWRDLEDITYHKPLFFTKPVDKLPPGNDPSPQWKNALKNDCIYDIDAPGMFEDTIASVPNNAVERTRMNFREFGRLKLDGVEKQIRCSPISEYYVLFSMRLQRNPSPPWWSLLSSCKPGSLDEGDCVAGDSTAALGLWPNLTWDLK